MRGIVRSRLILAGFLLVACISVMTQPARSLAATNTSSIDRVLDALYAVHEFREVSISPDGQRVAWGEVLREANGPASANSAIYVATLSAPETSPHRITAMSGEGDCEEHDLAWSPDGRNLTFLSDAQTPRRLQLYVVSATGGPARKLTNLTGFLATPRFSPDGKSVALLFTENAAHIIGPLMPVAPPSGVIGSKVEEQRLMTFDVVSGRVQQISPADMYVYEYDWSPDSKHFAVVAAHGEGDANWYIAELSVLDVASGAMKSIYKPPLQIGAPR
jgi:WD40-like Beta Propeller Repeat